MRPSRFEPPQARTLVPRPANTVAFAPATAPSEGEVSARAQADFNGRPPEPERTSDNRCIAADCVALLAPYRRGYGSVARLAGGAPRPPLCDTVFTGRGT